MFLCRTKIGEKPTRVPVHMRKIRVTRWIISRSLWISEGVMVTYLSAFLNSNDNDITLSFLPISLQEKDKRLIFRKIIGELGL